MAAEREKIFTGGLTTESLQILAVPIIVSGYLLWYGFKNDPLFPPQAGAQMRDIFVLVPWILAGIILLTTSLTFISNVQVKLTFTSTALYVENGDKEFSYLWSELVYSPPSTNNKWFRALAIGRGKESCHVYSAFMPKFDTVLIFMRTSVKETENG